MGEACSDPPTMSGEGSCDKHNARGANIKASPGERVCRGSITV